MTARVIIGPWPGSTVVPIRDCRIEFARRVEQRLYDLTEATMAGRFADAKSYLHPSYDVPSDTEML